MDSPLVNGTPLEDHRSSFGLLVKREDLSCPPPGPPFSKTRGVFTHMKARMAEGFTAFGVLDTAHSQGGLAVAHAGSVLGARVTNYYPVFKRELDPSFMIGHKMRPLQDQAEDLGAVMRPLTAGRSAILYHQARKATETDGGYMYPNALKLPETVTETAAEVARTFDTAEDPAALGRVPWIISASSGTIAAGVVRGLWEVCGHLAPPVIIHLGYDRSEEALEAYLWQQAGHRTHDVPLVIVNEGYSYADAARAGVDPPWPCNRYYDLKALRWWCKEGQAEYGPEALLWNVG